MMILSTVLGKMGWKCQISDQWFLGRWNVRYGISFIGGDDSRQDVVQSGKSMLSGGVVLVHLVSYLQTSRVLMVDLPPVMVSFW